MSQELINYYAKCNLNKVTDNIVNETPDELKNLMQHLTGSYVKATLRQDYQFTQEQIDNYIIDVYKIMNLGNLSRAVYERYILENKFKEGDQDG